MEQKPISEVTTEAADKATPASEQQTPACAAQSSAEAPAGFEAFDLDDIEVIESKVFA